MKKILTLVMVLALVLSMGAFTAVAEDAENINYVSNPMMIPNGPVPVPANSTVYYSFSSQFFNGWVVSVMGASQVTLDGAECQPNMFGAHEVTLKATSMDDIVVGIVNNNAEDINVMVSVSQPLGSSIDMPVDLYDGENVVTVDGSNGPYYTRYMPSGNHGDLYIDIVGDSAEYEVGVIVGFDGTETTYTPDEDGAIAIDIPNVEQGVDVFVVFYTMAVEATVNVELELPPAGSELNPIWVNTPVDLTNILMMAPGEKVYMTLNTMTFDGVTVQIVAGEGVYAMLDDTRYDANDEGVIEIPVEVGEDVWSMKLVIVNESEEETVAITMAIPEIQDGDVAVELPEESMGYYAYYVAQADGTLTLTIKDATEGVEYDALMMNTTTEETVMLSESESTDTLSLEVSAGDIVIVAAAAMPDEETWATPALNATLTVAGPVAAPESSEEESSEPESSEEESSEPESSEEEDSAPATGDTENPDTGVASGVTVAMALLAVSGAFVALESKKRG